MKKIIAGCLLFIGLTGCGTLGGSSDPNVRWATAQTGYNGALEIVNAYLVPCAPGMGVINAGLDHPDCHTSKETLQKLALLKSAADITVRQIEASALEGGGAQYEIMITEFEGLLAQIVMISYNAAR